MLRRQLLSLICICLGIMLCCSMGQAESSPAQIIIPAQNYTSVAEQIGNIVSVGDYCILQGGYMTQDVGYFILLDKTSTASYVTTRSIIVKYDMHTMEQIACSDRLSLGHANDIAYLPETNELCVIHVSSKRLSILDADTLTVKEKKTLPVEGYAIDYVPERDSFVLAYGRAGMFFMDANLKGYNCSDTLDTTLVTQGICADISYVYHILWSYKNEKEPDSVILVCDWNRQEVTRIPIGLQDYEPENISIVGDCFYIACNNLKNNDHAIFKVSIKATE